MTHFRWPFLSLSSLALGCVFLVGCSSLTLNTSRFSGASEASNDEQGEQVNTDDQEDYDRLDGTGTSRKKVNVIEWEGNLEIHVYPAGSLKGLALMLDKRNEAKTVMVIGYRFGNQLKNTLIRRAILGIPLEEGFNAYQDLTVQDYDKIVISNQRLEKQLRPYPLDPPPTRLYP